MQKHDVNIYAIAEEAGVSIATVSRVINNSTTVSEKSKKKVLDAVKKLNYVPNNAARSLSTATSNLVGVVIPDINNPFFSQILQGITRAADERGLNIFLFNTDENASREHYVLQTLREHRLRGIIITPVSSTDTDTRQRLIDFESLGIPVVLLDRELQDTDFDRVAANDREGSYQAVTEMIRQGHEKIAIISGPKDNRPGFERLSGYLKAMEEAGLPIQEKYIRMADFRVEGAYREALVLGRMEDPPTAIFTANNLTTYGCLKAFAELGIEVGRDMALFSFDEIDALNWLNYKISVVDRDVPEMGAQAMHLLLNRMEGVTRKRPLQICLPTKLILRGSERLPEGKGE